MELYKFIRPTPNVIVPFTGDTTRPPAGLSQHEADDNLEEVLNNVRRQLRGIWSNLPDDKRRKRAIKRLLLKWHPDKNLGREEFCTSVFQQIQCYVVWLDNDNNIQSGDDIASFDEYHTSTSDAGSKVYHDFFDDILARGKFHARSRASSSSGASGSWEFSGDSTDSSCSGRPNPQPVEGRRWLRQAGHDLRAARLTLTHGGHRLYSWACYQAHQVDLSFNHS